MTETGVLTASSQGYAGGAGLGAGDPSPTSDGVGDKGKFTQRVLLAKRTGKQH